MVAQVRRLPISQRGVDAQTRLHGAGAERHAFRTGCPALQSEAGQPGLVIGRRAAHDVQIALAQCQRHRIRTELALV